MSTFDTQQTIHTLYIDHHGWLHGWLWRKLGCSQQAQDLVHDTFVRLLMREETATINEPRAFLTVVAQRVLSNHRRRQQIERVYLEVLAQLPESSAPSPESQLMVLETLFEIDRLLNGLPQVVKQAFLLSQLDGLAHADIAERLFISVSTVKRHLLRAGAHCYFALEVQS